jgi:hypothetical protein
MGSLSTRLSFPTVYTVFNEGWIEFEDGGSKAIKGSTNAIDILAALVDNTPAYWPDLTIVSPPSSVSFIDNMFRSVNTQDD